MTLSKTLSALVLCAFLAACGDTGGGPGGGSAGGGIVGTWVIDAQAIDASIKAMIEATTGGKMAFDKLPEAARAAYESQFAAMRKEVGDATLTFHADGTVTGSGGPVGARSGETGRWTKQGDDVAVTFGEGAEPSFRVRLEGGGLDILPAAGSDDAMPFKLRLKRR